MTDQCQEPNILETDRSQTFEVNSKNDKSVSIPTLIFTPASPDALYDDAECCERFYKADVAERSYTLGLSLDFNKDVPRLLDMNLLSPPPIDTEVNTRRPPFHDEDIQVLDSLNTSRQEEGGSEEDLVQRFSSSTPIIAGRGRCDDIASAGCSLISLSDASPIAPDDNMTVTPNRSTNRPMSREEAAPGDVASNVSQHENVVYMQTQYFIDNRRHTDDEHIPTRYIDANYVAATNAASYSAVPKVYPAYMDVASCYTPTRDSSWTDLSYRTDTGGPAVDVCCYPPPGMNPASSEHFVYPSIYVSSSGLISVLLRNDMSVEMTVDRTIRVVSHNHMMAVATDSRGTAACLYHPAIKVLQVGTTTDIAAMNFRARMGADVISFSNGINCFKLEDSELQPTGPIKFTDIFRDQSVNLLFSSEGYGESLVASCMQVAAQAEYANLPKGGVIVRINGVKVTQTGGGDVTVVTGAKFIRLSPHLGTTRLGNRFVDIEVDKDWTVKLNRGSHSFIYSKKRAMVCNGKMEAGFDETNGLKVTNLQLRLPLLSEPSMGRRPCRKQVRVPPVAGTPKRRPVPSSLGRGGSLT